MWTPSVLEISNMSKQALLKFRLIKLMHDDSCQLTFVFTGDIWSPPKETYRYDPDETNPWGKPIPANKSITKIEFGSGVNQYTNDVCLSYCAIHDKKGIFANTQAAGGPFNNYPTTEVKCLDLSPKEHIVSADVQTDNFYWTTSV